MKTIVHWDSNYRHPATEIQLVNLDCCRIGKDEQLLLKYQKDKDWRVKVIYSTIVLDLTENESEQHLFVSPCDEDGFILDYDQIKRLEDRLE